MPPRPRGHVAPLALPHSRGFQPGEPWPSATLARFLLRARARAVRPCGVSPPAAATTGCTAACGATARTCGLLNTVPSALLLLLLLLRLSARRSTLGSAAFSRLSASRAMAYRNARSVPARRRSRGAALRGMSTGRSEQWLYRCMRGDGADLRRPTHGSQRIIVATTITSAFSQRGLPASADFQPGSCMILRWNFA